MSRGAIESGAAVADPLKDNAIVLDGSVRLRGDHRSHQSFALKENAASARAHARRFKTASYFECADQLWSYRGPSVGLGAISRTLLKSNRCRASRRVAGPRFQRHTDWIARKLKRHFQSHVHHGR